MAKLPVSGFDRTLGPLYRYIARNVEEVATSVNALSTGTPPTLDLAYRTQLFVTDGAAAANKVTLPNGDSLGDQLYLKLKTKTDSGDSVVIDANITDTSWTFDAETDELLAEWNGSNWTAVYNKGVNIV